VLACILLRAFKWGFWFCDITVGDWFGLDPTGNGTVRHDCVAPMFVFLVSCIECAILLDLPCFPASSMMYIDLMHIPCC
jgi:hypothetical protein